MNKKDLDAFIETILKNENELDAKILGNIFTYIVSLLDSGTIRVAEKQKNEWAVNHLVKKAILMGFKYREAKNISPYGFDKIDILSINKRYRRAPCGFVREGVFIADNAVIMPSYINIGAYIDERTMIDMGACIGSGAQIGKDCHISAGACLGGILEPVTASPVIIEDNCFVGANSSILEGVIVEEGAIIAAGLTISASTKIINRETEEIFYGKIPKGAVVVPGSYRVSDNLNVNCAIIVKEANRATKEKIAINDILRDFL